MSRSLQQLLGGYWNHKHRYKLVEVLEPIGTSFPKSYMFHCQDQFCPGPDTVKTTPVKWFWTKNKKNHPCGEWNTCNVECEGFCK